MPTVGESHFFKAGFLIWALWMEFEPVNSLKLNVKLCVFLYAHTHAMGTILGKEGLQHRAL